jgi:hypothetical protein
MTKWIGFIFFISAMTLPRGYDVQTIIQRSVEANQADWNAAPDYDYCEQDRVPGDGTKTYAQMMILGSAYAYLVAINGKALPPQQEKEEQQKLEETIADRRTESVAKKAERVAKYERSRARDHLMFEQLTQALNFKLMGQRERGPSNVYVLKATPRPGYRPPNEQAKVLRGMQGTLWIDKNTFQWVKVEADVIHPVTIEGFLAQVEPGTHFELEKMPVTNNLWLPKHYSMKSRSKILFILNHTTQDDERYFDYRDVSDQTAFLSKHPAATGKSRFPTCPS